MKNEKMRNLIYFLLATILSLSSSIAYPYDTKEGGHIGISRKSIELKINIHGGDKLSQELGAYSREIIDGNVKEDMIPQWVNHFYDPTTGKGLWNRYFPAPEVGKGWYEIAKDWYCKGNKQLAWFALGHVLHLIQDVTVPAHSHGTVHWPPPSYESYIVDNWDSWISYYLDNYPLQNRQLSNIQSYFDEAANESFEYPYDDTFVEPPKQLTLQESYSTAKALVPLAVEYGAGLINQGKGDGSIFLIMTVEHDSYTTCQG